MSQSTSTSRTWIPRLLGATSLLSPLLSFSGASAQTAPPPAPGIVLAAADAAPAGMAPSGSTQNQGDGNGLGEIVVTATRSAESIQRVPISMQALSPEKLTERQVANFADYVNLLPSVSFSSLGPGRNEVFFRGISVEGGNRATVGTYLDDIPITSAGRLVDVHVYDVERVEALSGPQGTLFGASSLAGTLRIITKKPSTKGFEAGYDVQANKFGDGNFGTMEEGFINLPVNEDVAVRLMGFYSHAGGYIDNVPASITYKLGDDDPTTNYTINNSKITKKNFNPDTEYGGRLSIGIDLNDHWTILPSITAQYLDAKGSYNYDPRFGDLVVHDFHPTYNKDKWYQAALTIEGKIGDLDVVSATGYFQRKVANANDYTYYTVTYDNFGPGYESYLQFKDKNGNLIDPTQQYIGKTKFDKLTQEFRVSTPKDWLIHGTAGAFYQHQKQINNGDYYITGLGDIPNTPAVKRDAFYLVENNTTYNDYALFAEGSVDIFHNLTLTGGVRGFKTNSLVFGFGGVRGSARRAGCTTPLPADTRLTCINTNIHYKESGETHKGNLTWQIDPKHMVYATYSTGFRPGGGNRIAPDNPYKADTLSNYELGFKTRWGSNVRVNGAVYYERWNGIQYLVVPFGFQGAGVTVNAGAARVYGVEMDADWRIGSLTLSGSGAYNNAALAQDFCKLGSNLAPLPSCSLDTQISAKKGTRLPRQPKLKVQGSARYERTIGSYAAYAQAVGYYQTSSTSNLDTYKNSLLGNTPGFASFDFAVGAKRGAITFELFIQNAFDRRGQLSKNTFCSIEYCASSSRTYPIKPQFFGVRVGQRF